MKKFTLFFIFFYFIFNIEGNAYAHNEDKFVFLICEDYPKRYEVHIDFKKKTVSSFNMKGDGKNKYKIYDITERWISAKTIDNENERILIHRYAPDAVFQEFKDGEWKDIYSGNFECEKISKKF
tara:strand:- start:169 stop:540 length:372 start_codon:yes stop_codon:yes gene_type:complete